MDDQREVRLPNALSLSNTGSNDFFQRVCRERGVTPHPARMPVGLAAFFIEFLTERGYMAILVNSETRNARHGEMVEALHYRGIDGLIMASLERNDRFLGGLTEEGHPPQLRGLEGRCLLSRRCPEGHSLRG